MIESLWAESLDLPNFTPCNSNRKTDILIIGGGLAGLLCAYFLHQAGADYLLIEADRIGHGVTRNTTAKITSQHGLIYDKLLQQLGPDCARYYWQANEAALACYRNLAGQLDCDFEITDNWIYSVSSEVPLKREANALKKLAIPFRLIQESPLPMETKGAIGFQNQAQFHPIKFIREICRNLNICEHTRAIAFDMNGVMTNCGYIAAPKMIVATHFPILNKHGGYFLKQYQQRSYVLGLENAGCINGMYLDCAGNGLSFRNHRELMLIGGGGHRTGKHGGGWKVLESFVREYYPDAIIKYRWATQDCMTLDGMPYIGQYSKSTPNLYVATGFNKWGMTTAMVSAMVLTELLQGRESPYGELFSPSRRILHPQLAVNAVESAVNLLKPTKPRCPHLGCALKWNKQERTWDCPCHGSRFAESGELLDNPATSDLKWKMK